MAQQPARRRRTREESRAETRRLLLDAAATVFVRRGFQGASVEEITAEAGFTRGAFYSNFESKEQMFVELLHERVYRSYTEMLERVPTDATPLEQVRWAGRDLMERYRNEEDQWLFELWLECLAHAVRHPDFASLAAGFWSGNRQGLAAQIEQMYTDTGTSPPLDPKAIATAVIAIDIGLKVQHLVDPEAVPLELYPILYEALFGPMVAPPKPE